VELSGSAQASVPDGAELKAAMKVSLESEGKNVSLDQIETVVEYNVEQSFTVPAGVPVTPSAAKNAVASTFNVSEDMVEVNISQVRRLQGQIGWRLAGTKVDATIKTTDPQEADAIKVTGQSTDTVATTFATNLGTPNVAQQIAATAPTMEMEVRYKIVGASTSAVVEPPAAAALKTAFVAQGGNLAAFSDTMTVATPTMMPTPRPTIATHAATSTPTLSPTMGSAMTPSSMPTPATCSRVERLNAEDDNCPTTMKHMDICNRQCADDEFVVGYSTCLDGGFVGRSMCLPLEGASSITTQSSVLISGQIVLAFGSLTEAEVQKALRAEAAQEMHSTNESRLWRLDAEYTSKCSSQGLKSFSFEIVVGNSSILDATIDPERLLHRLQVRLNNSCIQWREEPVVFINMVALTAKGEMIIDASQLTRPLTSPRKKDSSEFDWVIFGLAIAGTSSCLCCFCIAFTLHCIRQKRVHQLRGETDASPCDPLGPPVLLTSSACVVASRDAKEELTATDVPFEIKIESEIDVPCEREEIESEMSV